MVFAYCSVAPTIHRFDQSEPVITHTSVRDHTYSSFSDRAYQPAIDPDILTSDVTSTIRQKERNSSCNFFRRTVASHWYAVAPFVGCGKTVDPAGENIV